MSKVVSIFTSFQKKLLPLVLVSTRLTTKIKVKRKNSASKAVGIYHSTKNLSLLYHATIASCADIHFVKYCEIFAVYLTVPITELYELQRSPRPIFGLEQQNMEDHHPRINNLSTVM